jgi:glutathione synthase/RimK-type ligase-like ATP-grasp enzyme
MSTFAVVASRATPTNARLGPVLTPAQAVARLRRGDVALGRLDVLPSLDGVEPGLWALDLLERRGVTVFNRSQALATAHDKLATAEALACAGVPHPPTVRVAPWLPPPALEPPLVLKPRFGSWGRDVTRCDSSLELGRALAAARLRVWFNAAGGIVQRLVPPAGFDLRVLVAGDEVVGAVMRQAAPDEWRTNVALGGRRDPVGIDLLPVPGDGWLVLEVNGAVDFNGCYSLGAEIFSAVKSALLPGIGFEADAQIDDDALGDGLPDDLDRLRRRGAPGALAAG